MELWRDAMHTPERRREPALPHSELERFLRNEFAQVFKAGSGLSIEEIWHGGAQVRQAYREDFIRPGGTISGPTMMALADFAMYVAVLAAIGLGAARSHDQSQHQFLASARRCRPSG